MRIMGTLFAVTVGAAVALTGTGAGAARAAVGADLPQYQLVELGTLDGGPNSYPTAVNDLGDVVGSSQLPDSRYSHAFRWSAGSLRDLGVLDQDFPVSYAYDINNAGDVVGASASAGGGFHAVLWRAAGLTDLGTLGGASSSATSINDLGQVVGRSQTGSGEWHGFQWRRGVMTDLGVGAVDSTPLVNNVWGTVAGGMTFGDELHAFRVRAGSVLDLGSLANFSYANAVNDLGDVVGFTRLPSGWGHGFRWRHGVMSDLGILGGGAGYSSAVSINDFGRVVGNSDLPGGGGSHPVMWDAAGALTDLTTRGVHGDAYVYGINNRGFLIGSRPLPTGDRQAVLYTY